jgi:hypothetical protein
LVLNVPDEKRPIMAIVSRPPVLRIRHEDLQILLDSAQVQTQEFLGVVERFGRGIRFLIMLRKDFEVELFGPPILVGGTIAGMHEWTIL